MKHTLTLTGSLVALTAAMHAFEAAESGVAGNDLSTDTGTGGAVSAPIPAVPIPPAPVPSMTPTPTADEAEEGDASTDAVDKTGLPWDERIHSSSRKMGKDGTWNKRRGGPTGAELAAIEAGLRAVAPAPVAAPVPMPAAVAPVPVPMPVPVTPPPVAAPVPTPIPMPVPVTPQMAAAGTVEPPVAPAPMPLPMPVAAAPAPVVPTPEPVAPAPVETPVAVEWDFATFMHEAGSKFGEGPTQLSGEYLTAVCGIYGLGAITDLSVKPEMIPQIIAQFAADGRW